MCWLFTFVWTTSIKAFIFGIIKPSSHKEATASCSTQFDYNDECAGLSARISITTMNEVRSRTSLLPLRKRETSAVERLGSRKAVAPDRTTHTTHNSFAYASAVVPLKVRIRTAVAICNSDAAPDQNDTCCYRCNPFWLTAACAMVIRPKDKLAKKRRTEKYEFFFSYLRGKRFWGGYDHARSPPVFLVSPETF